MSVARSVPVKPCQPFPDRSNFFIKELFLWMLAILSISSMSKSSSNVRSGAAFFPARLGVPGYFLVVHSDIIDGTKSALRP